MTQQAVLFNKIEKLPPKYFGQVFDFVGYVEQKAKEAEAKELRTVKKIMTEAEEIEIINRNAERLNRQAEESLMYQADIFEAGDPDL